MKAPIIIALDGMSRDDSLRIAEETRDLAWGFKAHELLIREGFGMIAELKKYGNVFADLKFHDIPATVGKEVRALAERGADLISVHASGGRAMLEAAAAAGGERIAAVTALTSLSASDIRNVYRRTPEETVRDLAMIAHEAGVANIVCSPHEIAIVKSVAPDARVITPGIRGPEDLKDDQNRTMTAQEAIAAGAELIVIGRPITKAPHPRAALEELCANIARSGQ